MNSNNQNFAQQEGPNREVKSMDEGKEQTECQSCDENFRIIITLSGNENEPEVRNIELVIDKSELHKYQ